MKENIKILPVIILIEALALITLFVHYYRTSESNLVTSVDAQVTGFECVGNSLAVYMNAVIDGVNQSNIRLLSPAFNLTNPNGAAIANAMIASGANFAGLYGLAGNAYECCGFSITSHVNNFRDLTELTQPLLLTETGYHKPPGTGDVTDSELDLVAAQMDYVQTQGSYIGAIYFHPYNLNEEWSQYSISEDRFRDRFCGGSCNKLGANSAAYYTSREEFYNYSASVKGGAGTFFILEISNADQSTFEGVERAIARGITPVVRIGTAHSAGPDAYTYAQFLNQLGAAFPTSIIYAIAGPNEPQSECWAAPECGCELSPFQGVSTTPLGQGFHLGKYACWQTAEPEYHDLRPYPANACDPLIPRSIPEAPLSLSENADYMKYNTFACGTSLTFSHAERFDPYGNIPINTTVTSGAGNTFLHTYCDFDSITDAQRTSTGYYTLNCWRSVAYTVYADFSKSNIGILGNTQNPMLTDSQKVSNYLSWYFVGTHQVGDNRLLNMNNEEDVKRLTTFAGPVRKLLPFDAIEIIRSLMRQAGADAVSGEARDVHDYALNTQHTIRLSSISDLQRDYFPNIPITTLEDIAGEGFFSGYGGGGSGPVCYEDASGNELCTVSDGFTVTCGVGAHQTCPPVLSIVNPNVDPSDGFGTSPPPPPPPPAPCYGTCVPHGSPCYLGDDFAACPVGQFCCHNIPPGPE